MDLGTLVAIVSVAISAAVTFGVPILLWRFHRRLRDLEHARDSRNASAGLSEDRLHQQP